MRPTTTPREEDGGRPKTLGLPLTASEIEKVDDVRFSRRFASRAEALRHLLMKGLEAERDARS